MINPTRPEETHCQSLSYALAKFWLSMIKPIWPDGTRRRNLSHALAKFWTSCQTNMERWNSTFKMVSCLSQILDIMSNQYGEMDLDVKACPMP
ncbi:unnamed protein product [Linum trigynum]|uniref:Uncharacterized protein n=1 Tax=Linum trigynum TaxID=586398 RepID=A0AAV2CMI3_9ROSI